MNFDNCVICLENISPPETIAMTDCNHLFHRDCMVTWIINTPSCPLCRRFVTCIPDHGNILPTLPQLPFEPTFDNIVFTIGIIIRNTRNRVSYRSIRYRISDSPNIDSDILSDGPNTNSDNISEN
jgi:hypothetical protein